jgi:hypothetical protein
MLVLALYVLEVFVAHPNANLQIASVLAMADETIDQFRSGHKRVRIFTWRTSAPARSRRSNSVL